MFFLVLGSVCASEVTDVSNTEDSNLIKDNDMLSSQNLEVSNEVSISETNSHDDNLNDYPDNTLESNDNLITEDNKGNEILSSSDVDGDNPVISDNENSEVLTAKKATTLTITDTHYNKVAKFQVTLKSGDNPVSGQKVTLTINGKTYSGTTGSNGIAIISTTNLPAKSYDVKASFAGNSEYDSASKTTSVKVLSSISGKDLTKGYGYVDKYYVTCYKDAGVLANTPVYITIAGKTYKRNTDSKGVAMLLIGLKPGKYPITVYNPVTGEKASNTIYVNKDQTNIAGPYSTTYVTPKTKYTYTVTLKSKHNVAVSGATVYFKFNGKQVTAKTNSEGKASMTIPALSKGTYSISFSFKGNNLFAGSSGSGTIKVQDSTVKMTSSPMKSTYKDGKFFKVKLVDNKGNPLANKKVKIAVAGKTYNRLTDSKGIASLEIGLPPKTYTVKYAHSSRGLADFYLGSNTITVSKQVASVSAGDLVKPYGIVKNYQATIKDIHGKPLKNVKVNLKIAGKTYKRSTDAKGVVKLPIGLKMGAHKITTQVADNNKYYTSKAVTKTVYVDGVKFVASPANMPGGKGTYHIKLLNVKNQPIKDATVKILINGKTSTVKTDSRGIAKTDVKGLGIGVYNVRFASNPFGSPDSFIGTSKIYVGTKVSISQYLAAAKYVKDYTEKNRKLPSSVNIGPYKCSMAQFLYVSSKAIVNLNKGSVEDLYIFNMKAPSKPGEAANLGNLYDYASVAKAVVNYADANAMLPASVNSKVGKIGFNGLVYSNAKILTYYANNKKMPAYVNVQTYTYNVDIQYLLATANCQVNNAQIKALAERLTSGKTSDWDKATAIFNYVRDHVSYSFYYDTRYGAVGTINAGTGNCVDHAHACNALFRASGLGARYVHGTCTFSSGSVYGHVWSQVYVDGSWVVADASSYRNSLGNHVNWGSGSIHGYYTSLPF